MEHDIFAIFDATKEKVKFGYDKEAQVLYISFGPQRVSLSEEQFPGILVRTDLESKKISGITILDYKLPKPE